ncbi:hypothetical protein [Tsukamurella spumae]|uniref:Uncharacterized protein n=1 Tax=Tsukamurella spumae TaxID=44753 RepID=A0A846WY42_9ACTN|nr:hypothetical protein [Tsukamurella spumae]NKY17811.1 hypothetical protein [Tsukamurella spumae]
MNDDRVAAKLASIHWKEEQYLRNRAGRERQDHIAIQRSILERHQPQDGAWGAPCTGDHDPAVAWPCETVLSADNPVNYLD